MTIDIVGWNSTVLLKQFMSLLVDRSKIFLIPRNILVVANLSCKFLWQATFRFSPDLRVSPDFRFSPDSGDRMAVQRRLGRRDFRSHSTLWLILLTVLMKGNSS